MEASGGAPEYGPPNDPNGLDDRTRRAVDNVGSRSAKLGAAIKAASGNKKALIGLGVGGGLIGLILALIIGFAQLKMINMMGSLAQHFGQRNKYTFDQRKDRIMREYFNKWYGNAGGEGIDDATAPIWKQSLRAMHEGPFEKKLNARYDIKVRAGSIPNTKIVEFKDKVTGETFSYDTSDASSLDAAHAKVMEAFDNVFHDETWAKRTIYRYRLTSLTGVEWHWLDPIKKPYKQAQTYAANQVAVFLMSPRSPASGLSQKILKLVLGDDTGSDSAASKYQEALDNAAADEAAKIVTKEILTKVNIIGDIVSALGVWCGINNLITNNTVQKIVQSKAEVEEMTAFAAWSSKADQQKSGKTDATTVTANLSLLSTEKDSNGQTQDISYSNNWARANGQDVAYKKNDNCDNNRELCNAKTPNQITHGGLLGALSSIGDVSNNPFYVAGTSLNPLTSWMPGTAETRGVCAAYGAFIKTPLSLLGDVVVYIVKAVPGSAAFMAVIGKAVASAVGSILNDIIPPVIDATTRGPALLNILASGADLAYNAMLGSPAGSPVDDSGNAEACYNKDAAAQKEDGSYCLPPLKPDDAKAVTVAAEQADAQEFKALPTYQKIASIDNSNSLLSRLVANTPASPTVAIQKTNDTMLAVISPGSWKQLFASIPSLFSAPSLAMDNSLHGIIVDENSSGNATSQFTDQYGASVQCLKNAPLGDKCVGNTDDWVGCTLVASAASGNPDDMPSGCPKDPNTDQQQVCDVDADPAAPATDAPTGSVQDLAKQILANKNVTYPYKDDPRGITVEPVMQKIADTGKAFTDSSDPKAVENRTVEVNPNILKAVLAYAKDGKIGINALTNADHSSDSAHYSGEAIDFDCALDTGKMDTVAAKFGGKRNTETCDHDHHWHYDFPKSGASDAGTPATDATTSGADCSSSGTATEVSGDRAALIKEVLGNSLLKLGNYGNGASQKHDIETPQPSGGVVDNLVKLMAAIMDQGHFKLPVNALRSDHSPEGDGDGLHNPAGAAVDIGYYAGDPDGTKLYKWIYDNRKVLHINMMIWNPPPNGYKCVGQGEPVDCLSFFGAATMAEHANHIHVGVWKTK